MREILKTAWATKKVKEACNSPGLLPRLEAMQEQQEVCKKSLSDFLDGKRRLFPRFYFTSEADLLDILSNGSVPENILVHTPKVYLACKTLVVDPENRTEQDRPLTTSFIAEVGKEEIGFEPPVALDGKVEIYMQTVLDAMKQTLFQTLKRSLVRYTKMKRTAWLMHYDDKVGRPSDPAQIILLTVAVNYVSEVEEAFANLEAGNPQALAEYNEKQIEQLSDLIRVTSGFSEFGQLNKGDRTRVMVCITMDAHGRDIVQKLVRENVDKVSAFQWQSQLKHKYRIPPPTASFVSRDPHLRSDRELREPRPAST